MTPDATKVATRYLTARGFGLGRMRDSEQTTFNTGNAYAHVWFDSGVAKDDFNRLVRDSGEWEVRVTDSPDPLNLKPRGKVLAQEKFRYADPKQRDLVLSSAEGFIGRALAKFGR